MLRSLKDLEKYTVCASDGDIGTVGNFLLDDERWTVRYLVVRTNGLFENKDTLISPISFRRVDWSTRRFHLSLTMMHVKDSPDVNGTKPVSRQQEQDYYRYYGYPYYWGSTGAWGQGAYPHLLTEQRWHDVAGVQPRKHEDIHLRSVEEIRGYHIEGTDESIGHVEDFIVDDETWEIRYLVIDTSNWWFGKKVLVSPYWATRVSWDENKVYLGLTRQGIKDSPEWIPNSAVNREYESRLYDYYGRPVYWESAEQKAASFAAAKTPTQPLDTPRG
jgi:sporulation protein YlmC with PRC-barrel domain